MYYVGSFNSPLCTILKWNGEITLQLLCTRYEDMRSTSGSGGGTADTVWMNTGSHWKQHHKAAADVDIYAEVGDDVDLAAGFGFRPTSVDQAAPYATTTLAMQNKMRTLGGGQTFVSLPQQGRATFNVALALFKSFQYLQLHSGGYS